MSEYRFPREILGIIRDALPDDTSLLGGKPELKYMYIPSGHAKALHPDNMLVEGMRGAGKSFWWSSLQSESHRSLVGKNIPRSGITENARVSLGFGEKASPDDYPGRDALAMLLKNFDAREIWRTVVLLHLAKGLKANTPLLEQNNWSDRIRWVVENPEESERLAYNADTELNRAGIYHLILFDALDRTADDWRSMWRLVKGLLQVLLEFRSFYKRIRPKAFVRPDHLEDPSVTAFPDSSKILSQKVTLNWPKNELYGLFWQHLANAKNGELFISGCKEGFGIEWSDQNGVWTVPGKLRIDDGEQRPVFHAITGPWMGQDHRRGFPYTWLPSHLGDTHRQVSPRSFLAALRHAAEDTPNKSSHQYAMYYESIKRGVQEASKIRVREMQEDYPWVQALLQPLAGLTVPCSFADIADRWEKSGSLEKLQQQIETDSVKLPPSHLDSGTAGVREDLEQLGLFERLSDGRVNLPDVYRVGYNIGRRGGVKTVARS